MTIYRCSQFGCCNAANFTHPLRPAYSASQHEFLSVVLQNTPAANSIAQPATIGIPDLESLLNVSLIT
jgi:hypothetical protein